MNIVAYSVVGNGEAGRYFEQTLKNIASLADTHIVCLNNASQKERDLATKYGCHIVEDNREWGVNQPYIKEDLVRNVVATFNPDWCIGIDADEVIDITRSELETLCKQGVSYYFYVVNLIDDGYSKDLGTWVIRLWKWMDDLSFKRQALHGGIAPEWAYISGSYAPYPLLHSGLKKKVDRERKLKRYNKYDNLNTSSYKEYYQLLKLVKPVPLDVETLKQELLDYTKELKIKNMKEQQKEKEFYYIRRLEDGKVLDIPARDLEFTLNRTQNGKKLFELHQEKPIKVVGTNDVQTTIVAEKKEIEIPDEKEAEPKGIACEACPFLAKTKQGLKVHQKTHS